jgi:serine/threonine protein kinase
MYDEGENEKEKKISYENYIYKVSQNNKLKKYYLVLINKDIFYYKTEEKKEVLGMHNLSGCFVKENGTKNINDKTYYCFTLVFPSKERSFYCSSKEVYDNFNRCLKEAFGYMNFFDYYEMLDDLGEGIFGSVKLGVEKKTKERVAIKIIKKNKTKPNDIELVKTEIDVMKLCHHPNVVQLLDHFENAEYIFIVMEYIRGGRLTDYMKEKKFNFTEKRVAELIYQIALGVKYLHKYGIIHRDLKPDNIMLTEASDKGQIKIMDFGLSKILGKKEKAVDGFGTLTFVSPEVLIRKPYNKEIDIWSIGVILYMMLSGDLPFDDEEDDEQKIAKSIVYNEVEFPEKKFGKRSKEVIDLIKRCLTKEPKNRIKIDEILKSDWIQKNLGNTN